MPPEQLAVLQAQLHAAGFLPSTYTPTGTLDDDTRKALLELKRTASATGLDDISTLRQTLETKAQAAAGAYGQDYADSSGGSSGGVAPDMSPSVSVNETITEPIFTDPMTARGLVRDAMEARLGRAPTSEEYHQFRQMLRNKEGGQDVTTTRSVTKPGETDNDSRTTTRVNRSDDTTDPDPSTVAEEFTMRGKLGREANTVTAASFMDVIARRVGM
jgi:hypothetical protein